MEYKKSDTSWQESLERGFLDEALRSLELQIATNLMEVHNHFCESKLESPLDVYAYSIYGRTNSEESKKKMEMFIQIKEEFIEAGHGLDVDSTCPKEYVLEAFQKVENTLKDAMSKV